MKSIMFLIIILCAGLLTSCASVPPIELINARQAYQQASSGPAAQLVPADLHKAQEALALAEKSFQDDPQSFRTRDLAYIADRKAKTAEALATTAAGNAATAKANKEYQATQTEIVKNTKEDLATAERGSAIKSEQLAVEQKARLDAEQRASDAQLEAQRVKASTDAEAMRIKDSTNAAAMKLAEQKSRDTLIVFEKGKTVVLRGINFDFNKATLTEDSETILWRAYNAMAANPDVHVVITGHTDNVGSQKSNQLLSLKRAQAVRNWLVQKGTLSSRMRTVGRGQNEPVSSNDTDEGRADNRRIEFYVQ